MNTLVALPLQWVEPIGDDWRQPLPAVQIFLAHAWASPPTSDRVDAFLTAGHVKGASPLYSPPRRNDQGMTKP